MQRIYAPCRHRGRTDLQGTVALTPIHVPIFTPWDITDLGVGDDVALDGILFVCTGIPWKDLKQSFCFGSEDLLASIA